MLDHDSFAIRVMQARIRLSWHKLLCNDSDPAEAICACLGRSTGGKALFPPNSMENKFDGGCDLIDTATVALSLRCHTHAATRICYHVAP